MLRPRIHGEIESIQERLQGWQSSVPARARRFHTLRGSLDEQTRKLLSRLVVWNGNESLQRLRDRTDRLGTVAEPLAALIREAERLEEEVKLLARRARDAGSPEVAHALEQHCRDWSVLLGSLGADCDREPELQRDQLRLRGTEQAVRLHDQAVSWLQEARRVLSDLGSDLKATPLAAALPDLELRLLRDGAALEWIRELKDLVQPLKDVAQRLKDPPQELRNVSLLLTDLRGWSRLLREREDRVEQLEQRHHFYAADWSPAGLDELARDAEALRDELMTHARALRSRKLAEIKDRVEELVQACGPQPDLYERVAELEILPFDRYQLFREWAARFKRVEDYFLAIANTHEGALERRLSQLLDELRQGLDALRSQPLSDRVRSEADVLEHDLRELAQVAGAEPMLRGLGRSGEMQKTLDRLACQAREDSEELSRQQETLRKANQDLQARTREAGLALPDLAERIDELAHGRDEPSLERARQLAGDLAAELERQRQEMLRWCRSLIDQRSTEVRATAEALRRSGAPFQLPELPRLPDDAGPGDAIQALKQAEEAGLLLRAAVDAALQAWEQRRLQARGFLQQLRPESLGPEDRETVTQLLQELEDGSWTGAEHPVDRFELMSQTVEKCDLLFERLNQEERSARSRLEALRRRLQRYTESQMRRFSPELANRVADLIFGIPPNPSSWRAVQEQLDVADRLLGRIEAHSARLAAEELDRAAGVLRNVSARSATPEVRDLLANLERCSDEELPPVVLRMRIVNAARQAARGDHRP